MRNLHLNDDERVFLAYLARRIDREVNRWQRREQARNQSWADIDRLAGCALEILQSREELQAWLEVAT